MMKEICIVRHAKSSWDDFLIADIDRPLNERGHDTAPKMAKYLKKQGFYPDQLITSPAKRAYTTADYFAKEFKINKDKINIISRLYMAGIDELLDTIQNANEDADRIAIFAHNPGITEFANICCEANVMNVPTCGIIRLRCDIDNWYNFEPDQLVLENIYFPKVVLE